MNRLRVRSNMRMPWSKMRMPRSNMRMPWSKMRMLRRRTLSKMSMSFRRKRRRKHKALGMRKRGIRRKSRRVIGRIIVVFPNYRCRQGISKVAPNKAHLHKEPSNNQLRIVPIENSRQLSKYQLSKRVHKKC